MSDQQKDQVKLADPILECIQHFLPRVEAALAAGQNVSCDVHAGSYDTTGPDGCLRTHPDGSAVLLVVIDAPPPAAGAARE